MTVGEALSQARRDAGLSLESVAERTRIRRTLIEAIERDDFSACGGTVYARGHVRALASAVGIDPAPLLAQLEGPSTPISVPGGISAVEDRPSRTGPNWTAAMAVVLAVLVLFVVWRLLSGGGEATVSAPTSPTPGVSVSATPGSPSPATSAPSAAPSPTTSPGGSSSAPPTQGVTVVITATGSSWVSGTEGSTTTFAGLMRPGQVKTFTDPVQVKVVIGNAGAVTLTVNGRDLGSPGANGVVVRKTFGPGDPSPAAG